MPQIALLHLPNQPKRAGPYTVVLKNNHVYMRSQGKANGWLQELIERDPEGVTQGMNVLYNHANKHPIVEWWCPCSDRINCNAKELRDAVLNISLMTE